MRCALLSGVFSVVLASLATSAHADVVQAPPLDCPAGAVGRTSHRGPSCQPTTCETDTDCQQVKSSWLGATGPALVCREQGLCVERRTPSSQSPYHRHPPREQELLVAVSTCGSASSCPASATCEVAKRCVPVETEKDAGTGADGGSAEEGRPAAGGSKGCGCAVVPAGEGVAAVAAGLVVSGWMVLRRRRAGR
ncbi:uncharacterized protein CMC5_072840 [Chondromyces crocatus]|uniref:SRCR domain-containing protein n=2 Tax=Chondromyces crocatus TaxID=52 RepID=A0A0K1EQZ5_CHOCO|nr:uncharacterized protein CMC5_072840 [Chondromyces crocatus]